MAAVSLSVLFIYLIHSTGANINQRKYRKTSDVECRSNSSFAVQSNYECAFQCLRDEECAYYKMDMNADGFAECFACTKCLRHKEEIVSTWIMAIQTSKVLTGKSWCGQNDTHVYITFDASTGHRTELDRSASLISVHSIVCQMLSWRTKNRPHFINI